MMHPDDIAVLSAAVRADLLREAERDRLAAQLPSATHRGWLHVLADHARSWYASMRRPSGRAVECTYTPRLS